MVHEYEFIKHLDGIYLKTFFVSITRRLYHWHQDVELFLIIEGSVTVNTAQHQYTLNKDDLFLINRNEIHSLTRTKESNIILAIQIDPGFCRDYYPALQRIRFLKHYLQGGPIAVSWTEVRKCLSEIVMNYYTKEQGYQFKMVSTLNLLVYHLLQQVPYEYVEEDKLFAQEKNLERLNRIISYIQQNYMGKISLKNLALREKLDMYYLSHFIKKNLGISFQAYLNQVRLEKAVELMTQTNKRSLDIYLESGFSDYRYLSKMFSKAYGCTPAQYKSQYKSQYKHMKPVICSSELEEQQLVFDSQEARRRLMRYLDFGN